MEKLGKLTQSIFMLAMAMLIANVSTAQCGKFNETPRETEALEAHVLYRDMIKLKDYDGAFKNWKLAYELAPAADGKRATHFTDGIEIYKHKLANETDEAKKKEYFQTILRLYDEMATCYSEDGGDAFALGRKAFDMFYGVGKEGEEMRSPYSETQKVLEEAVKKGGNNTEYLVMVPYASVVAYQFSKDKMDKATAREVYKQLNEIVDFNIENNEKMKSYYEATKESMNATFAQIENYIFDCDYFKAKFKPQFEADPENPDFLKEAIARLKRQGCDPEDPFLAKLEEKWSKYAAEINAKLQAEFEANNPNVMAKRLYDEGDYSGAIEKYNEAIAMETDNEKKASYLFSKASIQFRKLKSYSAARSTAYEAAKARPGWGRPYMMIGDMYASSARSCGDSWTQRLAILAAMDKYSYAKSIDSEVADEASEKLGKYYSSMPEQSEGFMRGVKAGQTVTVDCWIGESVKVRYQ